MEKRLRGKEEEVLIRRNWQVQEEYGVHNAWLSNLADEDCFLRMNSTVREEGDMVIAGIFSLLTYVYLSESSDIKPSKEPMLLELLPNIYQNVLTFIFAIEEINRNPHLLSNISLGYEFHTFMPNHWRMLESSLILLTGQDDLPNYTCVRESKPIAVLTGTSWAMAVHVGTLLGLYKFPQLTFGGFDPTLSENPQFSSLYQMAPKDTSLVLGMVSLMLYFRWTWVGLVITEGQKGNLFLSDVKAEMNRNEICVAFVQMISNVILSVFSHAQQRDFLHKEGSPVSVVIIYYDTESTNDINFHIGQYVMTHTVWVTNSQWHADMAGRNFLLEPFRGTLIFSRHHEEVCGFQNFIQAVNPSTYPDDNFLTLFWYEHFQCSVSDFECTLENCIPNASLAWLPVNRFDRTMSDDSYHTYNAVYAVAHALHEMLLQRGQTHPTGNGEGTVFSARQLHLYLKNLQFINPAGDLVNLDDKRKVDAEYDILNFWNVPEGLRLKVKVGSFSSHVSHDQLSISEDLIEWATGHTETPHSVCSESCNLGFRKSYQVGKMACCFDCTLCPENEIANDTASMEECVKCPDHQYADLHRKHCLQKSVTFLAYEDALGKALAGTALSFTTLTAVVLGLFVKHRDTPIVKANNRSLSYILLLSLSCCFLCSLLFIGQPSTATCVLQQTTFGIVFTVAVSTVLAKTITVVLAFKVTGPTRRMRQLLVSGAPNCIIPICSLIQLTLCGVWMGTSPPFIDTDAFSEHGFIIIVCNKGSLTAFYCVLGYLGFLALVSFSVAFLARNLPDTFNEAKFLTFSMLVFCSVWVTFLPVYHSSKGKAMVAMEVFSILASSAGLLGCIFAPKCYIILFQNDRYSLQGIKGKTRSWRG
ncbi:vomeronasal type-2 receptor 116-like [Octodon degus]|uniref:Vomeronasal type-2 receptor 116-like n=1 Tax=Octodon degus TaxID=10160 RepID=A0A6P6DVP9_OCTDE|nr:vomeronasal type-2 receptor 116-like [Octodon degus]